MNKLLLLSFLALPACAQFIGPGSIRFVTVNPSGACPSSGPMQYNNTNGMLWGCVNGTWTLITASIGPSSVVCGTDTQIIFNNGGVCGANAMLTTGHTGTVPTLATGASTTQLFAGMAGDGTSTIIGLQAAAEFSGTSASGSSFTGSFGTVTVPTSASGNLTLATLGGALRAGRFIVTHSGSGTVSQASGVSAKVSATGTGPITAAAAYNTENPAVGAANTVTDYAGLWVRNSAAVTGTITTNYGVRVDTMSAGTTKWAYWAQTDASFFGGGAQSNVFLGIGTTPAVATCGTIGTGSRNAAGFITSATTGACVPVLTLTYTAPLGWSCSISNSTTANLMRQTATTTTTATFSGTTVSGDVLQYACTAY